MRECESVHIGSLCKVRLEALYLRNVDDDAMSRRGNDIRYVKGRVRPRSWRKEGGRGAHGRGTII